MLPAPLPLVRSCPWLLAALLVTSPSAAHPAKPPRVVLFSDDFETGGLQGGWSKKDGLAKIDAASKFAGRFGVRLSGDGWLERAVPAAPHPKVVLRFAARTSGLGKSGALLVEWSAGTGWTALRSVRSPAWSSLTVELPPAATKATALQLRFRLLGDAAGATADLDDLALIGTTEGTDI